MGSRRYFLKSASSSDGGGREGREADEVCGVSYVARGCQISRQLLELWLGIA